MEDQIRALLLAASKFVVAALMSLWIGMPHTLQVLFWVMLADQVSGMIVGGKRGELSSSRGWAGLKKKAQMWILIGVAHLADQVVHIGFDFDNAIAIYFIINEMLSILENCILSGVKPPAWLKGRLEALSELEPKSAVVDNQDPTNVQVKISPIPDKVSIELVPSPEKPKDSDKTTDKK